MRVPPSGPHWQLQLGPGALLGTPSEQVSRASTGSSSSSLRQPLAPQGCSLTFVAAARAHAGLEVLRVGAGDAEVQLSLEHALPHSLASVTGGGAAGRPRGPVGVDAGFGGVIWKERGTAFP